TIRTAQASSFVFGPAGIILERAILQLRTSSQRVHALIGRLIDQCFGWTPQWAMRGDLTWGHVSTRRAQRAGEHRAFLVLARRVRGTGGRLSRPLGAGDGNASGPQRTRAHAPIGLWRAAGRA